ncbi:unnamed protein product [Allacma fusca]|uniref:Peptidase S1 domain-containing protein n=1 Tax=Allacma fusca TaxID=39272 RepID=A0A8J2KCA4_9HEXA|nr:unnamed protein product [Allacma fusca]
MQSLVPLLFLSAVAALPQAYSNGVIENSFPVGQGSNADSPSILIVGGRDAQPGEFPWQVSLQYVTDGVMTHQCAGTIVDETHIVTASHCEYDGYQVVAGAQSVQKNETTQQRITALRFVSHPDFNLSLVNDDVAVMTLSSPLVFNDRVKPLRLPAANANPVGQLCVTSGWGNANPTGENPPIYPDVLQAVNLTVITNEECQERQSEAYVDETMICAHYSNGGKSACTGDSGGPLVCSDAQGPYLAGIASWIARPCGQAQFPTVFSRVSVNLDFIDLVRSEE